MPLPISPSDSSFSESWIYRIQHGIRYYGYSSDSHFSHIFLTLFNVSLIASFVISIISISVHLMTEENGKINLFNSKFIIFAFLLALLLLAYFAGIKIPFSSIVFEPLNNLVNCLPLPGALAFLIKFLSFVMGAVALFLYSVYLSLWVFIFEDRK